MVRLFTCLALTFFIFFASVPVSLASLEKNPLQFELTDLTFEKRPDGSRKASGFYELINLKGSIDLFSKKGQKISLKPTYFKSAKLDLKPTYTFTLGKKAEPRSNIKTTILYTELIDETYSIEALLLNQGEATATFEYTGLLLRDIDGEAQFHPEATHSYEISTSKLEPGEFARATFKIRIDSIKSQINYNYIEVIDILYNHKDSAPYKENTSMSVTVDNKKLVQQVFAENDVTYVSLRELADILGVSIQWDDSTQTATLIQDNFNTLKIPVGGDRFVLNGQPIPVPAKAKLYNNTILVVPLRDVAEMLECHVFFAQNRGKKSIIVVPPAFEPQQP
ncbi:MULTISPECIES: copper amine oxidase N-terminal domain-containing protein [Brevibacillus]|uniref:copper amine oxidase N-terminal domain-containing protein n=1 Tax=Brevibacillus TaxID=55080 RepID=UPI001E33DEBE|nr:MULTISPECIES: copper amine oxidase N-terminal domain-containing protein [Brevibacillus]MED1944557.1 copper amine oxidase N-terminal domain-containing protein [Brevibacillus formosus]MED1999071.1 copper amine oxidase N-terminal domain-containing protein [Brevibacillus formosus]MED2082792.1 copper amine oxidase N-terminal domain-containing protein [Brevibacillus formosus]